MKMRMKRSVALLLTLLMLLAQAVTPAELHQHAHAEEAPEVIRGTFRYAGMFNLNKDATLDYVYSDAYFSGDARVYNPSLSTMSLCLELAVWSSYDAEAWVDKSVNARMLLTDIGFTGFAQNDFWNDIPQVNSIGVVAAHKAIGDATVIALAVRGGGYYSEWGSNVQIGAAGEHTGFATARDNVLAFLQDYVAAQGITGRVKLWVVGYSRGGAVANMTAGYLTKNGLTGGATLAPSDLFCYTFEAPQGAMDVDANADADYGNIHNIINANDVVPLVAPSAWDFSRFNEASHLLPTVTTVHYPEAFLQMQEQYAAIIAGVEDPDPALTAYGIAEYARMLEVKVNWLSFLPGGDPFVELLLVDNAQLPQSVMLVDSINALASAVEGRDRFYTHVEADVSRLLGQLLSVDGGGTLTQYVQELGEVFTANNYENTIYVLGPVLQLNLTSFEKRMQQVGARLREVLPQPEGYTDIVGTVGSLADILATMIAEDPTQLLNLVMSLASTNLLQAHYPEVTMAWLRAEDPNFSDAPFTADVPEQVRIVRVNCPVDLYVYDSRDELVATIISGECVILRNIVGCAVNSDGEKVVWLPADESFTVEVIATGDGTVACALNEFNIVRGRYTRVISFPEVMVVAGDRLSVCVPAIPAAAYTDEMEQGSDAACSLLFNDVPVAGGVDLHGDQVASYRIATDRNNESGQVLGGGVYLCGSFAQVEAYPVSGGAFEGWYVDGALVSRETVYRFPVCEDVTVVAHFAQAPMGQVTFVAGPGGRVDNVAASYPAGSRVLLSAVPDAGYLFDEWNVTAGEIVHQDDETTWLIVAQGDATVTVSFVEAGVTCPGCRQVLPKGEHHLAICGRFGHYTCDYGFNTGDHLHCLRCGEGYLCQGGHGEGLCGMPVCEGCGVELAADESHAAPCGAAGHWTCAADYVAADHGVCAACAALLCDGNDHGVCPICNNGNVCEGGHGTGSGECGVYACEGCGVEILLAESHAAPCGAAGHWTCAADYVAADHGVCAACAALLCDGNNHGVCPICNNGNVCEGGHGTGSGECGVYACEGCGVEILLAESHAAPCGAAGHWTCAADYVAADHGVCAQCSRVLCDGRNHDVCPLCDDGYVCLGGHGYGEGQCCGPKPTERWVNCPGCQQDVYESEGFHDAPCGQHYTCESGYIADEHSEICAICGDYTCMGDHGTGAGQCGDASVSPVLCETCGGPLYNGKNHLADCGSHYTCSADYVAAEHALCALCGGGYVCAGTHGAGEGQCSYVDPADLETCQMCGVTYNVNQSFPHLAPCGRHYTCQTLDSYYDHVACASCSGYLCDGQNHYGCSACGETYCSPTVLHTVCEFCGEYVCSGNASEHGEGVCDAALTGGLRTAPGLPALGWEMLPVPGLAVAGLSVLIPFQRKKKEDR